MFVYALLDDWNYQLRIFIEIEKIDKGKGSKEIEYLKKFYINPYKHWFYLHKWKIEHFVWDTCLIEDIRNQKRSNYIA